MSLRGADGAVLIAIIALVFIHNRKLLAFLHFLRDLDNYLVLTFSHRNAVSADFFAQKRREKRTGIAR